jgi:battenin
MVQVRDLLPAPLTAAFFVCGLMNNLVYVVALSGAEDLLPGNAGIVLLADILPTMAIKFGAPLVSGARPDYSRRVLACALLAVASFYMIALVPLTAARVLGVGVGSVSTGLGEVTFLQLAGLLEGGGGSSSQSTAQAPPALSPHSPLSPAAAALRGAPLAGWGSGTGAAGLVGALVYVAMTNWFNLRPSHALELIGWVPLAILVAYFWGMRRAVETRAALVADPGRTTAVSDAEVALAGADGLSDDPEAAPPGKEGGQGDSRGNTSSNSNSDSSLEAPFSGDERAIHRPPAVDLSSAWARAAHVRTLAPYMVPLFLVYFAEYSINQGVVAGFATKREYRLYQTLYQLGVLVSRSSIRIVRLPESWLGWLAAMQFVNLAVLTLCAASASAGTVLPMAVVYLVAVWSGLLGGGVYVNAFAAISRLPAHEFSMGAASLADSVGIALAALCSIGIERRLKVE